MPFDPNKFDFSRRDATRRGVARRDYAQLGSAWRGVLPDAVAMNETFRRRKWIPRGGIRI